MSALIITLFCCAGLLAVAAMAASARHYAAAWFAVARQLERGGEAQRKQLFHARRLKQPPARRARARARRALGQNAPIAATRSAAPRKPVHNRYCGFGIGLGSDKLVVE